MLEEPNPRKKRNLFKAVKAELYRLLYTEESIYHGERNQIGRSIKLLVPLLSAVIASAIGLAIGIIMGLVAALLLIILKMGRQTWCKLHKG